MGLHQHGTKQVGNRCPVQGFIPHFILASCTAAGPRCQLCNSRACWHAAKTGLCQVLLIALSNHLHIDASFWRFLGLWWLQELLILHLRGYLIARYIWSSSMPRWPYPADCSPSLCLCNSSPPCISSTETSSRISHLQKGVHPFCTVCTVIRKTRKYILLRNQAKVKAFKWSENLPFTKIYLTVFMVNSTGIFFFFFL